MTRLVAALRSLDLEGELTLAGTWLKLQGERCAVYVVEAPVHGGYYTWCGDPAERTIEHYPDPTAAIRSGLQRASSGKR